VASDTDHVYTHWVNRLNPAGGGVYSLTGKDEMRVEGTSGYIFLYPYLCPLYKYNRIKVLEKNRGKHLN